MSQTINMVTLEADRAAVTQEQSDLLMNARCRLMTRNPWYGHIAMSMSWIPSNMSWIPESKRTMGVRIVNGGDIQCLYYPPFVDKMDIRELYSVIQHEIEHIVRCHCVRVGHRNPEAWNIAADMTVNGRKNDPRIGYREASSQELIVPLKGNIIWIPDDWQSDQTSEWYYDKLEKRQQEMGKVCGNCGRSMPKDQKGKGKGKDQGQQAGSGEGEDRDEGQCPTCGQDGSEGYNYGGISGKHIDDHSTWNQSDVSEDEARQVIKDVVDQATEKTKGDVPGHLKDAIAALGKPVVRWRELLRHYLGRHVGNQRKTYSRRNRRHNRFGVKGISHHAAANVVVIIDTSGSIGKRELEQFFAEIDAISSRAKVMVLQWDHAFQGYEKYRRGDWKGFEISGRGGTDMASPIYWLMENNQVADVQVMLTDGYCSYADPQQFPMITCITTTEGTTNGPDWGHTVRLNVNQ
jgi:predicted metal-dependent peptidase